MRFYRERAVTDFAQDETGVTLATSDGTSWSGHLGDGHERLLPNMQQSLPSEVHDS